MVEFITQHGMELLGFAGIVLLLADKITKLTPTKRDDEIVAKIDAVVGKYLKK